MACYNNVVKLSIAYNYKSSKPIENMVLLASLLISLHRSSTSQKPSVFIRFILNGFGKTIRNSTIILIEWSLHLTMSISKIAQC